jgi:putative ABC transport system ATP-binding protein
LAKPFIIRAINLSKTYKMGKITVPALREINLKVEKGDFIAIHGPSGSGKTTLLNLLGGLDTPSSGEVWIENVNITRIKEKRLSDIRCRKIGFVFQFYNLIPKMSALSNVELPMIFAKIPQKIRKERAKKLLETVGLAHRLEHIPSELSAGEQQRVAIARALANNPSIVLMDEPTGNLDEENAKNILKLIKELNKTRKQTFILSTHSFAIARFAQKVLFLRDGRFINKYECNR